MKPVAKNSQTDLLLKLSYHWTLIPSVAAQCDSYFIGTITRRQLYWELKAHPGYLADRSGTLYTVRISPAIERKLAEYDDLTLVARPDEFIISFRSMGSYNIAIIRINANSKLAITSKE